MSLCKLKDKYASSSPSPITPSVFFPATITLTKPTAIYPKSKINVSSLLDAAYPKHRTPFLILVSHSYSRADIGLTELSTDSSCGECDSV